MNTYLQKILLAAAIVVSLGGSSQAQAGVSFGLSYSSGGYGNSGHFSAGILARFGDSVRIHGRTYWKPRVYDPYWEPYQNGYWRDDHVHGRVWVSYDPWGEYTDHYGYWRSHRVHGWVWYPFAQPVWRPHVVTFFTLSTGGFGWCPYYAPARHYYKRRGYRQGFNDGYWKGYWAGAHKKNFHKTYLKHRKPHFRHGIRYSKHYKKKHHIKHKKYKKLQRRAHRKHKQFRRAQDRARQYRAEQRRQKRAHFGKPLVKPQRRDKRVHRELRRQQRPARVHRDRTRRARPKMRSAHVGRRIKEARFSPQGVRRRR